VNVLVREIAGFIENRVRGAVRTLQDPGGELRSIFHGPPLEFLEPVLQCLTPTGGIEATLGDGSQVVVPVLLPTDQLSDGSANPSVGSSGFCDADYLLDLRNHPSCPRFLALAVPARHSILSVDQATDPFGVSADNNGGSAAAKDWWDDAFVQQLVTRAIERHSEHESVDREGAHALLERAVLAADEGDRHDAQRQQSWAAISRVLSIGTSQVPLGRYWSLACGFPPLADGRIDAKEQVRVLNALMSSIVDDGYAATAEHLKRNASEEEQGAIDACLEHLQSRCDVSLALARAASFYYAPGSGTSIHDPPSWWAVLTTERLAELLEQEGGKSLGTLELHCTNTIVPPGRGLPHVVADAVELSVAVPDDIAAPIAVTVTREAGPKSSHREWQLNVEENASLVDGDAPKHRQPIRFAVSALGLKKTALRIVSLAQWEPGIVIGCRTATKLKLPSKAKAGNKYTVECEIVVTGEGRHLLDLYVAPGVVLPERAVGIDISVPGAEPLEAIVSVSARGFTGPSGLEIAATAECYYDLDYSRGDGTKERLRLHITSDDETPNDGSRSEFERLIRLNRLKDRRGGSVVQVDRQHRVADLQAWALDAADVHRSFYPLVLASDCRERWRRPSWGLSEDTILSRGRFLHDPRPAPDAMSPPQEFIDARLALAQRIRGNEGDGLIEEAELGAWMRDGVFAAHVDAYVRSYLRWLEEDPATAVWADLVVFSPLEADGCTLSQEPDAVLVSPLHPVRIGWHCLAQRALWDAWRADIPCPAGSILDPDAVPDVLSLALRTPGGFTKQVTFLATECTSDYWSVLWNGSRLDRLPNRSGTAPFDEELGLRLGGVSSGFSVAQVRRSLDDVASLMVAKPVLNVAVASNAGHSDACNDGIMTWARDRFSLNEETPPFTSFFGTRQLQVFDQRPPGARPEDATVANLTEDTSGAVKWFAHIPPEARPDLGIIAQLETSNAAAEPMELGSPLGLGALIRHRVRAQLAAGSGAFLSESRTGAAGPASGDGLADAVMRSVARLENLRDERMGYTFAPSVQVIQGMFGQRAEYVAVSSSAVDPACFLGGWLDGVYLWDYELPSYSHRAGDTNGYYLLSRAKKIDCEALQHLLARLPGCESLESQVITDILLEVARRGIPTVRGLSSGASGAAGDLGLFLAGRLLQDEFRGADFGPSITPVLARDGDAHEVSLVIPVDPFRGYLLDLQRSLGTGQFLRPDLVVASISITDSSVRCRITPIEVKYRREEVMHVAACRDALSQAAALSALLSKLWEQGNIAGSVIWKLAFQHLLVSILDFGFRVYSQQLAAAKSPGEWSRLHHTVIAAILGDEAQIQVDPVGRALIFDASTSSQPRDIDGDGFKETIVFSAEDAGCMVSGQPSLLYARVRDAIQDWGLRPTAAAPSQFTEASGVPGSETIRGQGTDPRHLSEVPATVESLPPESAPPVPPSNQDAQGTAEQVKQSTLVGNAPSTPSSPGGVRVLVGSTIDGFTTEQKFLRPSLTALNQLNMGVVGDLGTGKTQLVKSLVYQISRSAELNGGVRPRFLIFDYKKDYSSPDFVDAVGARVVTPHNLPLNMFDISGSHGGAAPWLDRFKFFADVLDKIYSNVGPVQRENLKQAVRDSYQGAQAIGGQPTIYDVYDRYKAHVQGKPDAPMSIIGDMVDMELFAREAGSTTTFGQFLDGVVVLSLDALGQDDRTKNMLVAIMLNMFYEHMLHIPKRPYTGTDPQLRTIDSYLLVDEADNIMRYEFDVLRKILLQGREFGVGVILASQYLRHFKAGATDYREPLLSWFIHKVPNVSPQELASLGLTGNTTHLSDRIRQLGNHQCLFKTFDVPGEIVLGTPFYSLVQDGISVSSGDPSLAAT
jgi:hypothetical protein